MNKVRIIFSIIILISLLVLASCAPGAETTSKKPSAVWTNETSLNVADEFVSQLNLSENSDSRPVFLVGRIDTVKIARELCAGLEYDIELKLVNTGKVSFINDKKKRNELRDSRISISDFENEDAFYSNLRSLKVDNFIEGKIVVESDKDSEPVYIVDLQVFDAQNRIATEWQKVVKR